MSNLSPEYLELKKQVEKQRKIISRKFDAYSKERDVLVSLFETCTHEEIEKTNSYIEGNYYDKSQTHTWNQCKLCGAKSEVNIELGYYA